MSKTQTVPILFTDVSRILAYTQIISTRESLRTIAVSLALEADWTKSPQTVLGLCSRTTKCMNPQITPDQEQSWPSITLWKTCFTNSLCDEALSHEAEICTLADRQECNYCNLVFKGLKEKLSQYKWYVYNKSPASTLNCGAPPGVGLRTYIIYHLHPSSGGNHPLSPYRFPSVCGWLTAVPCLWQL